MRTPPDGATCVFCGAAIGPDEPISGRPPMAAHPACADRALADDRHWDAVAGANPQPDEGSEPPPSGPPAAERRAGCFAMAALALVLVLVLVLIGS